MDKPFALIIEDDRDVAALFRHVLDVAGYRTEVVLDGREAVSRLAIITPDVVLLDLQLPGVSGLVILQKIRNDERLKNCPVIVITAFAHYLDDMADEPDLILLKPVNIDHLGNLVQRLRSTTENLREPPYDDVTRLYTKSFFSVRLAYALERIKQIEFIKSGVLFADLENLDLLKTRLEERIFNKFLREMAEIFKKSLRPTDTVAWAGDGHFLALIDEVTGKDTAMLIAQRIVKEVDVFLEGRYTDAGLKKNIGVVLCDAEYINVENVLEDVNFARTIARGETDIRNMIFTREGLRAMRLSRK